MATAPTPRPAPVRPAATPAPARPTAAREGETAPGVLELKGMTDFQPPAPIADFLNAHKTSSVNVRFGSIAQGPIDVTTAAKGKYRVKKQPVPLVHPAFARVTQYAPGLEPALFVAVHDVKIVGEVGLAAGEKYQNLAEHIRKSPEILGLLGITIPALPTIINKLEEGNLHLGLKGVPMKLGAAFSGTFSFEVIDTTVNFDGSAAVVAGGLANGTLELHRAPDGTVTGKVNVGLNLPKNFSGGVDVSWDGVAVTGMGKVGYKGEKFSGEVTLYLMERSQAIALAASKKAPEGAAPQPAAPGPAAKKPARIDYVVFGEGDLGFAFTEWLNGTAHVIVDPKGHITVIGKLTPQKEFLLFPQKDYVQKLFKLEARATYGIPVVGDVFIFANVGMDLFAHIGPAKFYNIVIDGTYSTDPAVAKNFTIRGTFNMSAAAGADLRAEAGVGLEILDHDIKAGAGITGTAGIKAYAEATPIIGYRENAVEGQDKKGEWYIRGELEVAAQPYLGLSGDLFVAIETPWWSPLSNHRWTWPLFNKQYALGGNIGMLASVDYVFGSGQWPKLDLKPAAFEPEKFMSDMYDDKSQFGMGLPVIQKPAWKEKNSAADQPPPKTSPKGTASPGKAPKPPAGKSKPVTGKKTGKPADPSARTKEGKSVKQLQEEAVKKGKKPDGVKDAKGAKVEDAKTDKTRETHDKNLKEAIAALQAVTARYAQDGASKDEVEAGVNAVRRKFKKVFKSLKVIDKSDKWVYVYAASPDEEMDGPKKAKVPKKLKTWIEFEPNGNKSELAYAAPLTATAGNTTGTRPVSKPDFPVGWKRVAAFDPEAKYWVRMHLINENLHGPGNRFENLTPGDKGANYAMERDFESVAKTEVGKGSILWYKVKVNYRTGEDADFAKSVSISLGHWNINPDAPEDHKKGKQGAVIKAGPPVPVDTPGKAGETAVPVINSNQGYRQFAAIKGITEHLALWLTQERDFSSRLELRQKMRDSKDSSIADKIDILEGQIKLGTIKLNGS